MSKPLTFIGLFIVGAAVMFIFDNTFTLALGCILQIAAIVLGVFAIATPEFTEGDETAAPASAAEDA